MTRFCSLGIFIFGLLLNSHLGADSLKTQIAVSHGWSPAAPPNMSMHAGYFILHNQTSRAVELLSVSSPAYESIEIHESQIIDGIAGMSQLPSLSIEPDQKVVFKSGGLHLMMRNPGSKKRVGDSFAVQLQFSDGALVDLEMKVSKYSPLQADAPKSDMHHHHHKM